MTQEEIRLSESGARRKHWKRWGPYVSERAWGTVREDYSPYGNAWEYFSHDQARSRAYRWNEDGLAGISDRHQRICFAVALWNGRDPINFLIIEALQQFHHFLGDDFRLPFPTASDRRLNLGEVAAELSRRLIGLFL